MAPKSKKKGVHTVHDEHPHVVRNRERRKAQAEKKARRASKMQKSKRKSGAQPEHNLEDNLESGTQPEAVISSHETSVEENIAQENTNRSSSTTPQQSSSDEAQQWIHVFDNNLKSKKKTRVSRTSEKGKPTIENQADDSNSPKNITETSSTAGQSSSPTMIIDYLAIKKFIKEYKDETPTGANFKATLPFNVVVPEPETPMTRTSKRKKSFIATEPAVPETQKKTTGFKQVKSTDTKTGQVSSKSIPKNYLEDAILQKDETKIQSGPRKKDFTSEVKEYETLATRKTIGDEEFTQTNLQKIPLKASPKDLTIKKNLLQKKLEHFETEKKFLDNQEKELAPLPPKRVPKNPLMAISGVIKIFDLKNSSESNKEEFHICSLKDSNSKILQIMENNVQISIVVFKDTQVICKRIQRPVNYSSQDHLESRPRTFEGQTTVPLDKDVRSVTKKLDETLIDTSNLDQNKFEPSLLTLEDQAAIKPDKDVRSNPGHNDETVKASSNLSQDGVESFPPILEDPTTVKSDQDISSQLEHHNETPIDSSNLGRDDAESWPQTLESQYTITSDEDVRSGTEQHDETLADSSNLDQDVKSYSQTSDDPSTTISDKDVGSDSKQHDETPTDLSNFGQDDGKTSPQPIDRQSTFLSDKVGSVPEKHEKSPTDSSNLDQDDMESRLPTLEGGSTVISEKDVRSDPEKHDETPTDPSNSENCSIGKNSSENDCSVQKSREENIRENCKKFVEDCRFACASFAKKFLNNLKTKKE